ncbi:FtsQ-type POTRA domain-containing protein [Nocardia otitidiscaviarum]|uniref:cell division protein FtsQ/DivIB n=1 Tax=Nocardia otitidiscaviarum TaxID=1823 RepID=UPI0009DE1A32|nr:FtsQ-type POTRA domain-containing protein [Nocardia otitidiscaviarum]MBF6485808.1 FtsQ-type POTRA domain-containing protein [Nocardia otitidiscaviarum]
MRRGGVDAETADPVDDSVDPDETGRRDDAARWARLRRGRREPWWIRVRESRRARIGVAAGIVVALALGLVAYFSPLLAVRTVRVDGLSVVTEAQVLDALDMPAGRSMLRIDTTELAQRVARLPKVHSVRVQRVFPSSVRVTVVERTPVLFFEAPDGAHLIDSESVEFAIEPAPIGVPKLVTETPGGNDPATRAAVTVINAVPVSLRLEVGEIVARSVSDIQLELRDGRRVLWGGAGDSERKAAVVIPLLTRDGEVFDISSPNLVTVK